LNTNTKDNYFTIFTAGKLYNDTNFLTVLIVH